MGALPEQQPLRLILITGLPGAGKSTLARLLARRHALPLIAKDTIKEPLMDRLQAGLLAQEGVSERERSRSLSDASFAVLFALARELLALGSSLILEGNFRKGEHEVELGSNALAAAGISRLCVAQVLCQIPEDERQARLLLRQQDPSRHPGHRDAQLDLTTGGAEHLDLPGERWQLATREGGPDAAWLAAMDGWLAGTDRKDKRGAA
jgi:predicted kinase